MSTTVAGKPGLDPTLPDVSIVLGGETLHLAYDFNAVCACEKVTGLNLLAAAIGNTDASQLRGLLWSALLKDRPDITLDQVGKMIRGSNLATVREALTTAWFGSVPDIEGDESGEDQAQDQPVPIPSH